MTDAREHILARIGDTTRHNGSLEERRQRVRDRLARHARGTLPGYNESLIDRFSSQARQAAATVSRIPGMKALPQTITSYIEEQALARQMVTAASEILDEIIWPDDIVIEQRTARASDQLALSVAFAGIAETGTLALLSGNETPTTLNFLPDNFICILPQQRLVSHMEDVWDRLREYARGMPRTLNYVTGPSRTADVEQTIQLGAHGPRSLHIIIVED